MKNHLDLVFKDLARKKKKALIPFFTAGYPNFKQQLEFLPALEDAGVDILELGVPFSDPIADGPVIQYSSQESLKKGTTLAKVLDMVATFKSRTKMPVVLMTYLNPVFKYGMDRFAKDAGEAGVQGMIFPDMIIDEARETERQLHMRNIHLIHLVTPTTSITRQRTIIKRASGFLYAVSVAGVTGARRRYTPDTIQFLKGLKARSAGPVCVGFGISGPEQIRQLKSHADGFIIGSRIIELIRKNLLSGWTKPISRFLKNIAKECEYGG